MPEWMTEEGSYFAENEGFIIIDMDSVDDPPSMEHLPSIKMNKNSDKYIALNVNDVDTRITRFNNSDPQNGTVEKDQDNLVLKYTPNTDFVGQEVLQNRSK